MFGNKALPSKIYSYNCVGAPTHLAFIDQQIRLKHEHRNCLVVIEYKRREEVAAAQLQYYPELAKLFTIYNDLKEQIKTQREELKAINKHSRRRADTKAQRDEIKALVAQAKQAYRAYKELKAECWTDKAFKAILKAIDAKAAEAVIEVRGHFSKNRKLYWGNYLASEKSINKAGRPPREKRFHFDGKACVQIQQGMSLEKLFACTDTRLRVQPVPEEVWDSPVKKLRRTKAWIRIGSEKRKPVWAEVDLVMHRPLPAGAQIKEAWLLRRRVNTDVVWKLQFVCSKAIWPNRVTGTKAVGIDVGWRLFEDRLRAAVWKGEDGRLSEISLPIALVDKWFACHRLQEYRDRLFNYTRERLVAWIKSQGDLPQWFCDETKHIDKWRGKHRLLRLFEKWYHMAIPGDEHIFAEVRRWRREELQTGYEQEHKKLKAIATRNLLYRTLAADLRKVYDRAAIEDTSWSKMKKRPEVEDGETKIAGVYSDIAAVGTLIASLAESFRNTTMVEASYSTLQCHKCGKICDFDAAKHISHRCEHCGETWDQDANAAENLLARLLKKEADDKLARLLKKEAKDKKAEDKEAGAA